MRQHWLRGQPDQDVSVGASGYGKLQRGRANCLHERLSEIQNSGILLHRRVLYASEMSTVALRKEFQERMSTRL